ncbi:MAG TPA: hypothetical protein VJI69_00195 [Bacteroidia bacterium]|nr:hypothetical protein [Bacteroidia bacterium]
MDELGRLVQSLTKSEKRYFKMFTSLQSGEKGYLKLFDAIEKMEEYDEVKIKKMFKGEDFIKRLPAVKHYLSAQILKSLRVIYSGNTIHSQLKEMIEDISILYEKRLYKQCAKIIDRAKELAQTNEDILQQMEINLWEQKVLLETLSLEKFEKTLSPSLEKDLQLVDLQTNIAQYRNLYNQIILINKKIKEARTEEEMEQFQKIINHPLMRSVSSAKSFDSKYCFYQTHLIYNHAKGDNQACLEIAQKQMELLEQFPQKIEETPKVYVTVLNNILLCQIHTHNYKNFNLTLGKLRSFPLKSLSIEVNRFVNSYIFEMVMYLDTGDFTKSIAIREEIIAGLKKYSDKTTAIEEITLLYNLFYSYFGTGEYSKALKIINKLLNEYQKELRYDIQSAARILNLILHYELENGHLLEYNSISAYRFLYKSKRLYKLEKIILDFFRKKMHQNYTPQDQIESFVELRKQFIALTEDQYEKKAFEYFDYVSWLDAHIEKKSFEEVVKEKFNSKHHEKTV